VNPRSKKSDITQRPLTRDEIGKAVQSSGYLFEQRMLEIFEKKCCSVSANVGFRDPEDGSAREIDIVARVEDGPDLVRVNAMIVAECKSTRDPLVFLSRRFWDLPGSYRDRQLRTTTLPGKAMSVRLEDEEYTHVLPLDVFLPMWTANPSGGRLINYSTQFCKTKRVEGKHVLRAEHGNAYNEYVLPLIKAVEAHRLNPPERELAIVTDIVVFYPLLIVSGPMYCYDYRHKTGRPTHAKHVVFAKDYQSERISGTFFIDVLSADYVSEYLSACILARFEEFRHQVYEYGDAITKRAITFRSRTDWLRSHAGLPQSGLPSAGWMEPLAAQRAKSTGSDGPSASGMDSQSTEC
jgi:hypothetical protein